MTGETARNNGNLLSEFWKNIVLWGMFFKKGNFSEVP
jgi:hypothetical protein